MINMLVVEDDVSQLISLTNFIIKSVPNIRLHSLVTTGKQALDVISTHQIDLILLDLNLPDCSGVDILNRVVLEYKEKYEKSIIVVSGNNYLISKAYGNPCVYSYIRKPYTFENSRRSKLSAKSKILRNTKL